MKTFKKIVKLFIIYIILFFIFYTLHFCNENGVITEIVTYGSTVPISNVIGYIITALIISLIMTIVLNIPIIIGLIIAKIVLKDSKNNFDNIDKSDKKLDNLQYYRDILSGYSPAELNYVYSANSQFPKDAITTLLSLKLKNVIDLNNETDTITILKDDPNLSNSEKYVLSKISDGKLKNFEPLPFEKIVQKDIEEKKLTNRGTGKRISSISIFFIAMIIIFVFAVISLLFPNSGILGFISALLIPLIFTAITLGIPGLILYSILKARNPYKLSKEGKNLRKKLIGLKNYITQFSLLEEKDVEDLVIWEDYLIYSIIFDINDDLVAKMREKYIVFDINSSINTSQTNLNNKNSTLNSNVNNNNTNYYNNEWKEKKYVNSNNEKFNKAVNGIIGSILTELSKPQKRDDK